MNYIFGLVSLLGAFLLFQVQPVIDRSWDKGKRLSEGQATLLRKQGIDPDAMPYGQARQLLNELFRRWDNNLCSFAQAKTLRKRGMPTNVTRDEAKRMIDEIAVREHWKPRKEVA